MPTNLTIKFKMDKKKNRILSNVELQSFYNDLSKKEKSEFLKFLIREFDYSYSAIQSKMTGSSEMNRRDVILISNVVTSELWKA